MLRRFLSGTLAMLGAIVMMALAPGVPQAIAASTKVIAVVVDFGTGSTKAVITHCIRVPQSATDADAVSALIKLDGGSGLRWASNGLLCGINGYPASGCGVTQATGGYAYWAYFHGSNKAWVYANNGPAEVVALSSQAVGLRFEDKGRGAGSDQRPRVRLPTALSCSNGILDAEHVVRTAASASAWIAVAVALGLLVLVIPATTVVLKIRRRED